MSLRPALFLAAALALAGCHRKEITTHERDEAANLVSEANFAVTIREWSRAEGLYTKAVKICPDSGDYWLDLGVVRMHLNDRGGARSAYKSAIDAYKDDLGLHPASSQPVIRSAYALVILGRPDEARSLVEKARSKNPDDRTLKAFVENRGLDLMIADPALKSISP
jgi:Flp pilus assembly protein TadD